MLEAKAELFDLIGKVNFICLTTNGTVKTSGSAVMGRGCALQAKTRWRGLDQHLGSLLKVHGNQPFFLGIVDPYKNLKTTDIGPVFQGETGLLSFPVKHRWDQRADIELIKKSAWHLKTHTLKDWPLCSVIIPRPGCGNGGLNWADVKPQLEPILDDRFTIITNEG